MRAGRKSLRRQATAAAAIAAVAVVTAACSSNGSGSSAAGSGGGGTLALGCYPAAAGTSWNTLFTKYVEPEFKAKYGATISYIQGNSLDTISKLQAEKGSPKMDAVCLDLGPNDIAKARGLLAPNDPSIVSNLKYVQAYDKDPNNIGVTVSSLAAGLAYNTKAYAEHHLAPPTSWNDLTNPQVKGHVVLTDISNTQGAIMLAMLAQLHGGSVTDITPGITAAAQVAKNSFASTNDDDVSSYYQSGGAWLSLWTNSEEAAFQQTGFPVKFVYPKEGAVPIGQTVSVVKNAPDPTLAQDFENLMLSPGIQKEIALLTDLTPAVTDVTLPPATAKALGVGQKMVSLNWTTINNDRQDWTQQWAQSVAPNLG